MPAPGATKYLWEMTGRLDWAWATRVVGRQRQYDRPRSGESTAARQDTEKESFMAKERGDYRQDARMNNRSHVSGTPLSGGG